MFKSHIENLKEPTLIYKKLEPFNFSPTGLSWNPRTSPNLIKLVNDDEEEEELTSVKQIAQMQICYLKQNKQCNTSKHQARVLVFSAKEEKSRPEMARHIS